MSPGVFDGNPCEWSAADRAALYNLRLAGSTSVRYGWGHYAVGYHHFCVPSACFIVDPTKVTPIVDVMIHLPDQHDMKYRKTAVLIRHAVSPIDHGHQQLLGRALDNINAHIVIIARERAIGGARNGVGDVGATHPIGTRIHRDGVATSSYA